jgi:hypothetical protein
VWQSVDLSQDPNDSTHWTGTMTLPAGQSSTGVRFLVQAANGVGVVGMDTADGDGYRVFPAGADTAVIGLTTAAPTVASPFGVSATVTNQGNPVAGRTVRFTVSRAGAVLFPFTGTTGADGTLVLRLPPGESLPSGNLAITADLIGASNETVDSAQASVTINGATITLSPSGLTTRAGTAYPAGTPLTATVTDARGPVPNVPVTFTLPSGSPGATFAGGAVTATRTTNAQGIAIAPPMTARTTVGTFLAQVSTPGAQTKAEAMAAQYGFGPFANPINNAGTTRISTANLPMMVQALLADGSRISDATANALVANRQVQLRWRPVGSTGPWSADTTTIVYDTKQHAFTADLKPTRLGWTKGQTLTVMIRILPGPTDVTPAGEDRVSGSFDLGSRSFVLALT